MSCIGHQVLFTLLKNQHMGIKYKATLIVSGQGPLLNQCHWFESGHVCILEYTVKKRKSVTSTISFIREQLLLDQRKICRHCILCSVLWAYSRLESFELDMKPLCQKLQEFNRQNTFCKYIVHTFTKCNLLNVCSTQNNILRVYIVSSIKLHFRKALQKIIFYDYTYKHKLNFEDVVFSRINNVLGVCFTR